MGFVDLLAPAGVGVDIADHIISGVLASNCGDVVMVRQSLSGHAGNGAHPAISLLH